MIRRRLGTGMILAGLTVMAAATAGRAEGQAIDTAAREAFIMDFDTGAVLLNRNGDRRMPTASMSKIMTMFMVFEQLKDGRLRLDDTMPVSRKAWQKGGSKMFVEVGTRVRVSDLIQGIIVQSGNDAAIVVAEALAGSESAFADQMTRRGREIGLKDSQFRNATGWPDKDHFMTARDLATLAALLIRQFPEYYHYYSQRDFTFNNIRQGNRNSLLGRNIGADGLKTGHTEAAGYGLTASARRGDRRLILVVNGLRSARQRAREAERLIDWAFRHFENYRLFSAGETIVEAPVWLGTEKTVPLIARRDVVITLPRRLRRGLSVTVSYDAPIAAPFDAGRQAGVLRVAATGLEPIVFPVATAGAVGGVGPLGKLIGAVDYMLGQGIVTE